MDDLQFRRTILAEPNSQDPELLAAQNADPAKKQMAKEIQQLDAQLSDAFKVPVPDDLCDKLILRQTMANHQHQKKKSRVHLALAASVAIAVGLTFNFLQFSSAYSGIGDYALAHVYHEENAFDNSSDVRVSLASLNTKMSTFSGAFTEHAGELISADYCRFDGVKSLHLVFQGKDSPVTVFIVPEREDVEFINEFFDGNYNGRSTKFGDKQMIVIGDKTESLKKWQSNLSDNIQWST